MSNPIIDAAKAQGIKSLTREENEVLYQRIREGDADAIKEMIEGNIALVITKVSRSLALSPTFEYLRDDLQAECYYALTKAVNAFADTAVGNPVGYLYVALHHAIVDGMWDSEAITVPRSTNRKMTDRPHKIGADMDKYEAEDHTEVINLRYLVQMCCEDEVDRQIVELREMGYGDVEIGERVDLVQGNVTRRRAAIYRRFLEVTGLPEK
jgi:hypothetical protein